jgi:2-oxoisovalerate dehydrogenase E1 component alpha subunit
MGNQFDNNKGRQMPIHYGSSALNFMTVSSPLTTQVPQAAGAGYSFRVNQEDRIAVTYFGEGAASEGDFHSALNFGATLKCQTLFICRNNKYAISTGIED